MRGALVLGAVVVLCLLAKRADAQARVSVIGWTAAGEAVLEIRDPMLDYRAEAWAAGADERFRAVCTPAHLDADEETCRLCADASACAVQTVKRKAKLTVKPKRVCSGPKRAPDSCELRIKIGRAGSVTHALWKPKFQAVVEPHVRADRKAVVLLITNEVASGDVYDTFMVLDLGD